MHIDEGRPDVVRFEINGGKVGGCRRASRLNRSASHPRPEGQNGGDEFADGRSSISYHSSGNYLAKMPGELLIGA